MEPELKRTGKGEWLLTLGRVPMLTPEPNSLTYGDLPPSTKTDVFVYADTKVEATLPSDLSPHVRIGIAGEGIDLFFMARHGEDALTALLRFSELLSKYAHALIDEAR